MQRKAEEGDPLRRTKSLAAVALTSALMLGTTAFPALAINDSRVPADECSDNPKAVGEPGGVPLSNPGIAQAEPVGPPVSANNPGQSTGAQGQNYSRAPAHCD